MEGEANPVAGENRDEDPWIILLHRQAHRLEQGPLAIYRASSSSSPTIHTRRPLNLYVGFKAATAVADAGDAVAS